MLSDELYEQMLPAVMKNREILANNKLMVKVRYFLIFLILPWFSVVACDSTPALKNQLEDYCQAYIYAVVESYGKDLIPDQTVHVETVSQGLFLRAYAWFGNIFQPFDSTVDSVYECKFQLNIKEKKHLGSLQLLLIENKDFAEYTKWDDTQIIDIGEVSDSEDKYYIVVKYLKIDDKYMHVNNNLNKFFLSTQQ